MPVLSVIIPVRNQARSLKRLLDNLKAQKTPSGWEVEIIVAENMSTDNTLDVIRESGVNYVICERLGSGAARNAGAKAARGNLFSFIATLPERALSQDRRRLRVSRLSARRGSLAPERLLFGGLLDPAVLLPWASSDDLLDALNAGRARAKADSVWTSLDPRHRAQRPGACDEGRLVGCERARSSERRRRSGSRGAGGGAPRRRQICQAGVRVGP